MRAGREGNGRVAEVGVNRAGQSTQAPFRSAGLAKQAAPDPLSCFASLSRNRLPRSICVLLISPEKLIDLREHAIQLAAEQRVTLLRIATDALVRLVGHTI